jgi:molybdate transport system substrate-binding protein
MSGQVDAREVSFQESIGNPIKGIVIPADLNTTSTYAGGVMQDAPHPAIATQWLAFLKSPQAQTIYRQYGFRPIEDSSK